MVFAGFYLLTADAIPAKISRMQPNHPLARLSLEQLKRAVQVKEQMAGLKNQLAALFSGDVPSAAPSAALPASPAPTRRTGSGAGRGGPQNMSPAARERIAAAQRERWASLHAQRGTVAKRGRGRPKNSGGMSEEGRARIIAAQKARWAKFHARKGR
jgi:hypothetical protein